MTKRFLLILVALLWCNVGFANSSLPKCIGNDDRQFQNCYGEYSKKKLGQGWERTFKGEFGNTPGMRDGYGFSQMYKDDKHHNTFDGYFKNDKPIYGKNTFPTGFIYEGEYKNGRFSFGEATYSDGIKYFGNFTNGLLTGFGRGYHANGKNWYLGQYKDQSVNGFGFVFLSSSGS